MLLRLAALSTVLALLCGTARAGAPLPEPIRLAEQTHVDIYKKFSAAVVGLGCKAFIPQVNREGDYFGTGTVISAEGLILTSTTVIPKDAKEIKVYFTDGRVRAGEFKQSDEPCEGVLIKVDAKALPFMRLANSKEYKVGDPVYSWGNPYFTIQQDGAVSLSTGTISGMYNACSVDDQSRYVGAVLETDAAVNPGSDGGPLTDAEGNLLGIMSLAFTKTRWLGLAIPSSRLLEPLPELKTYTPAKRSALLIGPLAQVWAFQAAFAEIAERAGKATVSVRVVREDETEEPAPERKLESLKPLPPIPTPLRGPFEARRPAQGFSAGLLVSADGVIITAAYVVDDSTYKFRQPKEPLPKIKKICVYLPDGTRQDAKVLAAHKGYDLAALKIEAGAAGAAKKFSFVELQETKELTAGSAVALLGRSENPGNLTINAGRISAIKRFRDSCCQVSCLMNYGNLGGPLIDLQGRVVGMATGLHDETPWRQNCGVGFMLNAETIKRALPDLVAGKNGEPLKRAVIGVKGDENASDVKGARIVFLVPGGPAEKAGMKAGDIVVACNAKPIDDWLSLVRELRTVQPGQSVKVKVRRGTTDMDMTVESIAGD